jgi:hypothetical protein
MDSNFVNFRERLAAYAAGEENGGYAAFREYAAEAYADAARLNDTDLLAICRAAEWETADFSEGLISEPELQNRLSLLLDVPLPESRNVAQSVARASILRAGTVVRSISQPESGNVSPLSRQPSSSSNSTSPCYAAGR